MVIHRTHLKQVGSSSKQELPTFFVIYSYYIFLSDGIDTSEVTPMRCEVLLVLLAQQVVDGLHWVKGAERYLNEYR